MTSILRPSKRPTLTLKKSVSSLISSLELGLPQNSAKSTMPKMWPQQNWTTWRSKYLENRTQTVLVIGSSMTCKTHHDSSDLIGQKPKSTIYDRNHSRLKKRTKHIPTWWKANFPNIRMNTTGKWGLNGSPSLGGSVVSHSPVIYFVTMLGQISWMDALDSTRNRPVHWNKTGKNLIAGPIHPGDY